MTLLEFPGEASVLHCTQVALSHHITIGTRRPLRLWLDPSYLALLHIHSLNLLPTTLLSSGGRRV